MLALMTGAVATIELEAATIEVAEKKIESGSPAGFPDHEKLRKKKRGWSEATSLPKNPKSLLSALI